MEGDRRFKAPNGKELENSRLPREKNWVEKPEISEEKKKRKDVQMKKLIGTPCKNNIDTVLEEYVS